MQPYDTVLEIIDPEEPQLMATATVPVRLQGLVDGETAYAYAEDEIGNSRIDIYRVVVER